MKDRVNRSMRNFQIMWSGCAAVYTIWLFIQGGVESYTSIGVFLLMLAICAAGAVVTPLVYRLPLHNELLYHMVNIGVYIGLYVAFSWIIFGYGQMERHEWIFGLQVLLSAYVINTLMIIRANQVDAEKINAILIGRKRGYNGENNERFES